MARLKGVTLPVEGLEALRLVDAEGLSQDEAAERMEVSRPTLSRILAEARQLVARALSQGWAIRIEGGDYTLPGEPAPGPCDTPRRRCRGPGGGSGSREPE
jgi:predicted DNA-binding protein (UPF0251 family)